MPKDKKIAFKRPSYIISCLRVALEKEKKKYKNCPVYQDLSSSYEVYTRLELRCYRLQPH